MNTSSAETTHHGAGSGRTRASGAHPLRTGLAAVLVLLGTFAGLTMAGVTPAGASTLDGVATIANPNGDAPLASGGSTTDFTVTLPANASCDGDTVSNGYHVYSYLVPQGTDPTWDTFKTGLPSRDYGFLTDTGLYYGKANTAPTTGQIIGIPGTLQFAPLLSRGATLDTLLYSGGNTSGLWEAGIACANSSGTVTDYWNTEVTFTADNTDPNGFVWSDTPGPCTADTTAGFFSAASATFNQFATNSFIATSAGCPAPAISEVGPLPTGVTLDATGVLSGTPTQAGSFPVTLSATVSGGGPATQSFTLNVPASVPYTPTIGTATGGNAQATVGFTPPSNNGGSTITSYTVTATDSTTPAHGGQTQSGSSSPITVTGLTNGDSYTFKVTATNAVGTGAASAASNAVVPLTVPDAPVIGTATGGNTEASVSFSPPDTSGGATITSYTVTAADSTNPPGGQTQSGSTSPITVSGLTNGDSYTFTVTATNSVGTGAASAASNAVVPDSVPATPAAPTATAGDQSATVDWIAPNDGGSDITGYVITPYIGATAQTPIDVGDVTTDNVTGLTNGTTYTFTVAATNSVGTGLASAASNAVTPATVPDTPSTPTATAHNASATVNWVAPNDEGASITGYVITPYIGATAQTPVDVGAVTTDNVTGLTNGTTYTFTVAATNSVGTGLASAASNAVEPITVPGAPSSVAVTAGKGLVKLTWKAPTSNGGSAITHYIVKPSTGASKTLGVVTSYTFTGLTNGVAYTFTVTATNAEGNGAASAKSKSVTPNGLYVATKSLPKGTKGAKYATVTLTEKNGVGTEKWAATGLPTGLKLSAAGKLSGKVSSSDVAKTYTVTVTVTDSSKPTAQKATAKLSLVVAS